MRLLVLAVLAMVPSATLAAPTRAQELRAVMEPGDLKTLRAELGKMRSSNRWPKTQQDRYVKVCLMQKAEEPSINRRMCECTLEVVMEKYATFGEYAKDLVDGGTQDEQVTGMTGMCLAAYGT